jgi:hypothetical protein
MSIVVARGLTIAGLLLVAAPAGAQSLTTATSNDPKLPLGSYTVPGGKTLELTTGVGSGLFRFPGDPAGQFWSVSDRGPNIACGDALDILGKEGARLCEGVKRGRIYPVPDYSPSIFRLMLGQDGSFSVAEVIPLKTEDGMQVTGLPNPLTKATTENGLDGKGQKLEQSASAVDVEAVVRMADRTFWLAEENAPSLLHVAADGKIVRRLVPAGTEADFAKAGYPVEGTLPAILAKRQLNRGLESLALGGDGFLYAVMQNPLANPDAEAFGKATNARLLKLDPASGKPVAEYVYTLEPMAGFPGEEKKAASAARISELLHVDGERFLIDDRTDKTTHILLIDLAGATDILGSAWDDPATAPSLEQTDLGAAGIKPVSKKLVLDSARHPELPGKIEGMVMDGGALVLINDDDFGIEGAHTVITRVEGLALAP